ncbi:MAG: hypothetical protein KJO70_06745, partial [Gammaproteobacteria bacterium]|nr:hypothetical protein [Gammaproteobacteria bacterium]
MRHHNRLTAHGIKPATWIAAIFALMPLQAQAEIEVCNAAINIFSVDGPTPFFVGDELTLNATIGAGLIRDNDRPGSPGGANPFIDFTGIGYGIDCGGGTM